MTSTRYGRPEDRYSELESCLLNLSTEGSSCAERLKRNLRYAYESELTPRQAELLQLYFGEGKTIRQIAREQGVAPSTVSRTILRAQNRLRRCLQYGF